MAILESGEKRGPQRTVEGFFPERPELFERLTPVPGLFSPEQVAAIRADPPRAVAAVNAYLRDNIRAYRRNTEKGDNPHERMAAILQLADPLEPVLEMLRHMRRERPYDPQMRITFLRAEVACHFCAQKALRARTLAELTCGHGGHVVALDGGYRLRPENQIFKNPDSVALKDGYDEELHDIVGCHATLEEYLTKARRSMFGGYLSQRLLVTRDSGEMSPSAVGNEVRNMTFRFLAERGACEGGIPGLVAFGPQGFRHVVATYLLKKKRGLLVTALALRDHPKTVKDHYSRYMPSDVAEELEAEWREIERNWRDG